MPATRLILSHELSPGNNSQERRHGESNQGWRSKGAGRKGLEAPGIKRKDLLPHRVM
jgi:hypothetical protein